MASGTLVGMVPAAFVNECMSTDQCLPILVEWADLGRGSRTGFYRPPRASVQKSGGRYGKVRPFPR